MRGALLGSILVLFAVAVAPTAAALETVSSDVSRTVTLAADDHDAYELQMGGKTVQIDVTVTGSDVDFYVLIRSEYDNYISPTATEMYVVADKENTRSFTYRTSRSGLVLVVDNQYWTDTGALPVGSVTYTLSITFGAGLSSGAAAIAAVLIFAVLIAIIAVVLARRRRKAIPPSAPVPPWAMERYPPPAAYPQMRDAPGTAVAVAQGPPPPPAVADAGACPTCGGITRAGVTFCTSCGTRIA